MGGGVRFVYLLMEGLEVEARNSCMLNMHSAAELYPPTVGLFLNHCVALHTFCVLTQGPVPGPGLSRHLPGHIPV